MLLVPIVQTFGYYAITAVLLCLNLLFLWMYSAVMRAQEKVSPNPEDAKKDIQLSDINPPRTARVLRAHANAQASIMPFLLLGLIYTLAGGGPRAGIAIFAVFCIARLLHTYCYLKAIQPWRTITFLIGVFAFVALMLEIVVILMRN